MNADQRLLNRIDGLRRKAAELQKIEEAIREGRKVTVDKNMRLRIAKDRRQSFRLVIVKEDA